MTCLIEASATNGLQMTSDGSGLLQLKSNNVTVSVPTAVTASTTNTVTNKIAITIGGTTYYLLASTSGT